MKYQLVQYVEDAGLISSFFSAENVYPAMSVRGFEFQGLEEREVLRAELQGQPKFSGVCGPMWNGLDESGEPIIRYEDWKAYERLSA